MAIKRVVSKPKTKTVKKYPTFDANKIYVWRMKDGDMLQLQKLIGCEFKWNWLGRSDGAVKIYDTFEKAICYENTVISRGCDRDLKYVYELDCINEVASLINNRNNINKLVDNFNLLEVKEEIVSNIEHDEVHIDDVNENNLYATLEYNLKGKDTPSVRILIGTPHKSYRLVALDTSNYSEGLSTDIYDLGDAIEFLKERSWCIDIYEFSGDNIRKEFLEWSLEKING